MNQFDAISCCIYEANVPLKHLKFILFPTFDHAVAFYYILLYSSIESSIILFEWINIIYCMWFHNILLLFCLLQCYGIASIKKLLCEMSVFGRKSSPSGNRTFIRSIGNSGYCSMRWENGSMCWVENEWLMICSSPTSVIGNTMSHNVISYERKCNTWQVMGKGVMQRCWLMQHLILRHSVHKLITSLEYRTV